MDNQNDTRNAEKEPVMTVTPVEPCLIAPPAKKRVAAYARVSSGKDAMLHSLSAQVSYYSEMIQARPAWEYCGVYADSDFTGTKDSRPEFQRLLADCRAGKIDMVITKSVSRFARNTITTLNTVRELKDLGIDCYFEESHIHSISGDGELLLTILASYAQEESLSVSENCKWKIRHGFQDGRPTYASPFGYRMKKGKLIVVPEEAEVVKTIFASFLSGLGKNAIMKLLIEQGATTRRGGRFNESVIDSMLRNEKYAGDLLLQKTFVADHISKRKCVNQGELPRYYITDDHEPIVSREDFDKVQQEIARRVGNRNKATRVMQYPLTGMIVCENCGQHYRRKTTNGRIAWNCGTFLTLGKAVCHAKQIPESTLLALCVDVLGLPTFDENIFKKEIKELRVPAFNHVVFVFKDGHSVERVWQDRSRRESWTDDMRDQARECVKRRYK